LKSLNIYDIPLINYNSNAFSLNTNNFK